MQKLLLISLIAFTYGNIFSQTWQPFGVPSGGGVTDMVYWMGSGANFSDKVWVSTSSYNWPTGQWGGVYYSATTAPYQGVWYQVAAGYNARSLAVGQDGKLYASIWYDPAFAPADGLYRFNPQVGVFGILYQAAAGDNIFSIAVKNSPHTIFGGTRNGVIRSTDNGVSFGYSNTGIPDSAWIYDIAIDSTGILAIASSKGVFISTDNGDNWLTTTGIPPEDTAKTLMFRRTEILSNSINKSVDSEVADELYTGTHDGKLFRSFAANGYTNALLLYLFSNDKELSDIERLGRYIIEVAAKNKNSAENVSKINELGGVYESTDDGNTWNQINNGLPSDPQVSALAVKEINETFAELYSGLFNDTTGGAGVYKLDITVNFDETNNQIPTEFSLEQNYPNPFNPNTTIQFSIPEQSFVKLEVFNTLGEKISKLISEELNGGSYEVEFNSHSGEGRNLPSGIYFYKLSTENFSEMKKMILLK